MNEVLAVIRARILDLERLIETAERNIAIMESDLASAKAILRVHESSGAADFLPHMSVRQLFKRREIFGYCREALERSDGVLDTRELAEAVMARKGLDRTDRVIRKKIVFSVSSALMTARRHRQVEDCGRRRGVRLWRLTSRTGR